MSFGVNAAPEKYQHIITQTMAGQRGVANIADDFIVHERDWNMTGVLLNC